MVENGSPYPTYEKFPSDGPLPARVSELLLSNDPPTATERDELLDITRFAPSILSDLDRQIAYLTIQRQEIALYHQNARAILHPIRLVPDDVLFHIFHYLRIIEDSCGSLDTRRGIWPMSQVCRQWRAIIVETPSFWSTLRIHIRPWTPFNVARAMFRLGLCINRSRGQELQVELSSTQPFSGTPRESLIYMLLPIASSWKTLTVSLAAQDLSCLNSGQGLFSSLQALSVDLLQDKNSVPYSYSANMRVTAFSLAPNLRHLTISFPRNPLGLGCEDELFTSSVSNITTVSMIRPPLPQELFPLCNFHNLTHLSLTCSDRDFIWLNYAYPAPFEHPAVTHLTLFEDSYSEGALQRFLPHFRLPKMKYLRLIYESTAFTVGPGEMIRPPFTLLPSSFDMSSMEILEIRCVIPRPESISDAHFAAFVEIIPHTLRVLKLRIRGLRRSMLEVLCDKTRISKLEYLDLRGTTAIDASPSESLLRIATEREGTFRELRLNGKLNAAGGNAGDLEQRWGALERRGLRVRTYGPKLRPFNGVVNRDMFDEEYSNT